MSDKHVSMSLVVEGRDLYNGATGVLRGRFSPVGERKIYCDYIRIYIPVGNEDWDLFFDDNGTVIESETASWNRAATAEVRSNQKVLEIRNNGGTQRPLSGPIDFVITGRVNMQLGMAGVDCEYHYKEDGEEAFHTEVDTFEFVKNKAEFYLDNFLSSDTKSGLDPITCFKPGEPIYFSWEGNGTAYELYVSVDGKMRLLTQTQERTYTYKEGITKDSTFVLKGIKTRNLFNGEKKSNGSRELYAMLTLTTDTPSLDGIGVGKSGDQAVPGQVSCAKSVVSMMGAPVELSIPKKPNYIELTAGTDGLLAGYLKVAGGQGTSSAMIRATAYGDGSEEEASVEDSAYCARVSTDDGKLEMKKGASVLLPLGKGKKAVLYWGMTKPSGGDLEKYYDLRWYFYPFGNGTCK